MIMIIITLLLTALCAFLYRIGGLSKEEAKKAFPWFPQALVNTKARDIGCALISLVWMLIYYPHVPWWVHFVSFGLMFGALTTYWGMDTYFLHGAGIVLAYGLYAITAQEHWLGIAARMFVLPLVMGIWCLIFENDYIEEYGRGGSIIATLPLMLLGR